MADLLWYARSTFGAWSAIASSGSDPGSYPGLIWTARVDNPGPGTIVWSHVWDQVSGPPNDPTVFYPDGPDPNNIEFGGDVNWPQGVSVDPFSLGGEGIGELKIFCEVDGVPVPGNLWLVWSPGSSSYADLAWGFDAPPPATAFWTDFLGSFEIVE